MSVMTLLLAIGVVSQPGKCDPEDFPARTKKEQGAINKAYADEPKMDEIRMVLRAPMEKVRTATMNAMLACKMPVALANDGVLSADYGSHMGAFANFQIVARAYLLPVSDSTVLVRLTGAEQSSGTYQNEQKAITNKNQGKSASVWIDLRNVAKQLMGDPALRPDWDQSTKLGFLFVQRP